MLKNQKKKRSRKGLVAVVVIAMLIIALFVSQRINSMDSISDYQSETVSKGTIETYYTFSGNISSSNTQNVMAQKIMQISEIKVSEGQKISTDDALFIASDNTEVKSKIDGTINKIYVEADQQVMSGSQLCEIIDFENLEVSIKVDEYDLSCVEIGKKIIVNIGSLDKNIDGTVSEISRTATSQNGVSYFVATVDLEYDQDLKVGMTAEAKILNKKSENTLVIPMKALSFEDDNTPYVYIADEKNNLEKVYITAGINDGKNIEVLSGLSDGQTIYYKNSDDTKSSTGFGPGMSNSNS